MESRWHLFKGQTLENTKISDRAKSLHINNTEWSKVLKHLDRKADIQKKKDNQNAAKQYLKEQSEAMTKNWDNSVDNIRKRKEEERLRREEQVKEDKMKRYKELKEEQQQLTDEYLKKVTRDTYISTGYPKEITSALIQSETIYERNKQIQFKEQMRQHFLDKDNQFAKAMSESIQQSLELEKKHHNEIKEKNKKYGEELKEMIKINEQKAQDIEVQCFQEKTVDRARALEEEKFLKKLEAEERLNKMEQLKAEHSLALAEKENSERQKRKENDELDILCRIERDAKDEARCLAQQEHLQKPVQAQTRAALLGEKLKREHEEEMKNEQDRINKAIESRIEMEDIHLKKSSDYFNKLKEDLVATKEAFLERKKKELSQENQMKRWVTIDRLRLNQKLKLNEDEKLIRLWQKILDYRKDLQKQIDEDRRIKDLEEQVQKEVDVFDFEEFDTGFFNYATEVRDNLRDRKRSVYPVDKVVKKYEKENKYTLSSRKRFY